MSGDHAVAVQGMLGLFRHPMVNVRTSPLLPDLSILLSKGTAVAIPEVSCSDDALVALLVRQLSELGIPRITLLRDESSHERELRVTIPDTEAAQLAVERAIFRSVMISWRERSPARTFARLLLSKVW